MSCTETFPDPLESKILKASSKLKSGLSAASIFAPSSSRSKKMLSLRTFANSCYSIRSKDPKFIPALVGGFSATRSLGDLSLLGDFVLKGLFLPFLPLLSSLKY